MEVLKDQIEASRALDRSIENKKLEMEERKKQDKVKDGPLDEDMVLEYFHTGWEREPERSKTQYWKKALVLLHVGLSLCALPAISCMDEDVCAAAKEHFHWVAFAFLLIAAYAVIACFNGKDYQTMHPDHIESTWMEAPSVSRIENWLWPPKKVFKVREYFHTLHEYVPPFKIDQDSRPQNFQRGECRLAAGYRRYVCTKLDFGSDTVKTADRVISLELVAQLKNHAEDSKSELPVIRERMWRCVGTLSGISIDRSLGLTAGNVFQDTIDYAMALIVHRREKLGGDFSYGVGN